MLDELPATSEPACPGASGPAPHGFTTHNRFIRGKSQAYVGPPGCEGVRYHGLDYMLLHNLYAIATPGTWNGDPSADPCALQPDGAPTGGGGDGGTTTGGDDDGAGGNTTANGCACDARHAAPPWWLGFAVVWLLRRRGSGGQPL
jgi:hypothetical protein